MRYDIITIFPNIFNSYLNESILKRAQKKGLLKFVIHNLRDFSNDKHKKVDDKPFGGGPGMVLQINPIALAVDTIMKNQPRRRLGSGLRPKASEKTRIILFSPRGKKLDSKTVKRLSKYKQLILICGRYEGVDERVAEHIADEVISIGDYVLSGGELPAMVLAEAVSRFVPGVLGKYESLEDIKGSYPAYTRPEVFIYKKKKLRVPKVLVEGHHKKIEEWRKKSK